MTQAPPDFFPGLLRHSTGSGKLKAAATPVCAASVTASAVGPISTVQPTRRSFSPPDTSAGALFCPPPGFLAGSGSTAVAEAERAPPPKRPRTAFNFFSDAVRKGAKERNPHLDQKVRACPGPANDTHRARAHLMCSVEGQQCSGPAMLAARLPLVSCGAGLLACLPDPAAPARRRPVHFQSACAACCLLLEQPTSCLASTLSPGTCAGHQQDSGRDVGAAAQGGQGAVPCRGQGRQGALAAAAARAPGPLQTGAHAMRACGVRGHCAAGVQTRPKLAHCSSGPMPQMLQGPGPMPKHPSVEKPWTLLCRP